MELFPVGIEGMGGIQLLRRQLRSEKSGHSEDVPVEPGTQADSRSPWFGRR